MPRSGRTRPSRLLSSSPSLAAPSKVREVLRDSSNTSLTATGLTITATMSSRKAGKRRRVDEDDERSESENGELDGPGRTSNGRHARRRNRSSSESQSEVLQPRNGRLNGTHDQSDAEEEEDVTDQDGNEEDDSKPLAPPATPADMRRQARASDGYLPGSIVRVRLKNFVTYDAVEFRPGPHLNMIVGPNGTGKSTVVCAIALGLGWKPGVLGRAKEVSSFVKQGTEDSEIEIELKARQGSNENVVIQRNFARDNRSEWFLNRKRSSAAEIKEQINVMGIDVSNLCCFLPQDRVAHFAQMTPSELLEQTQRAAGQPGMDKWHKKLIEFGAKQINIATELNEQQTVVTDLENNLAAIQRDVERAQERQQLEVRVRALNLRVMSAKFKDRREHFNQLKEQKKQAQEDLRRMEARLRPLEDRLKEVEREHSNLVDSNRKLRTELIRDGPGVKKQIDTLERYEGESQDLVEKLDSVRKREQDTKRLIANLQRGIEELELMVRDEPERPDTQAIDRSVRPLRDSMRALDMEDVEARDRHEEIVNEVRRLDVDLNEQRQHLAQLDNIKHMRLAMLQKADADTHKAVLWLRENSTLFTEKVCEPVMLEVSIKEQKMASAIESCINFAMMKTFICQNQEDYDMFGRQMDRLRLRVNFCDRGQAKALRDFVRPTNEDELASMGFDSYAIDLVEGPDIVLRYLCADANLHTIPVAAMASTVDVAAVERSQKFKRYITGPHQHTITYSQYGNRRAQTMTRNLRPARTFVQSVDQQRRNALDERIREINISKASLEDASKQLRTGRDAREKRRDQLRKEIGAFEVRKGELLRAHQEWERNKVNLQTKQTTLRKEQSRPTVAAETERLRAALERVHDKCEKTLNEVVKTLGEQIARRDGYDQDQLEGLRCQQRLDALKTLKERQESQFEDCRRALAQITEEVKRSRDAAQVIMERLREAHESAAQDVKDLFQVLEQEHGTAEQVEDRYNEANAQLEMAIGIDPGVLQDYEKRKKKIEETESRVLALQRSKTEIDQRVERYRQRWEPALEELVANVNKLFSRAFDAIGNAGEVQISRAERYEKWGIDILVKFRSTEELQKLNAHRQSGGERSISTITYLLSLTEMSRAPFSLVDEINQGMDQKYERQVHDHMVKVTRDGPSAGQYFLITPKLLPNLTYHERMRVLIINNGDWLPEHFSFKDYVGGSLTNAAVGAGRRAIAATS